MSEHEQPGGDIHGERAAESEPSELSAFEKWWAMLSKVPYMSKKEIAERAFYAGETASHELRFDACRPYLKEGETPAECLARNRADIAMLMGKWGEEKMRSAKLRTTDMKDAARYRLLRIGQQWSVIDGIGDTLRDEALDAAIDKARAAQEVAG